MAKGFMFPADNPVYCELTKLPTDIRDKIEEKLIESLQKQYNLDEKTVRMIRNAFIDRKSVELLLLTMSELITGSSASISARSSASILKNFGILNAERLMKILFELAKNRDALMDEYRKENRNKSDKILEMERKLSESKNELSKYRKHKFKKGEIKNAYDYCRAVRKDMPHFNTFYKWVHGENVPKGFPATGIKDLFILAEYFRTEWDAPEKKRSKNIRGMTEEEIYKKRER